MAIPSNTHRRRLFIAAASAAGLAGAGIAWWRDKRQAALQSLPSASSDTQVLDAFWALALATPNDKKLVLSSLKGKPLLINFWATWCPPCVEELPLIDGFYKENSKNGWQVLGLAVDQLSAVKAFLGKMPISFPVVIAGSAGIEMSKSLGNLSGGLPFTVVLNANGSVAQRKIGRITPQDLTAWAALK